MFATDSTEETESADAIEHLKLYVDEQGENNMASEDSIFLSNEDNYSASSTLSSHYVENLFDWDVGTNWQEGVDGSGIGEDVEINFADTQKISGMAFYMGSWVSEQKYYENNRPSVVTLQLDDEEFQLEFSDVMEKHYVYFSQPVAFNYIKLTIYEVYRGTVYDDTVISEINIFPPAD